MKKAILCPYCKSHHSGIASAYEDGGGDYGEGLTAIYDCNDCGLWFTEDEAIIGYTGQPDDNPPSDIPFGFPLTDEDENG